MPHQSKVTAAKVTVITDTSISDRCSSAELLRLWGTSSVALLVSTNMKHMLISVSIRKLLPEGLAVYRVPETSALFLIIIMNMRPDAKPALCVAEIGALLIQWPCLNQGPCLIDVPHTKPKSLVIACSPIKWAKRALHVFKERQESVQRQKRHGWGGETWQVYPHGLMLSQGQCWFETNSLVEEVFL